MTGIKLYEAVEAIAISETWLEEAGGELTPEVEALLDKAEGDFNEKVENVALKVKALEAQSAAIQQEADRLAARAKARATGAKSLKLYLQRCLEAAGKEKVNGLLCTVALQMNPPSVHVPDTLDMGELYHAGCPGVELVPERYVVSKSAMLAAVKARGEGVLPTGVTITRGHSVRIR